MKVIERSITPAGVEIQLEDWAEHNTDDYPALYGLTIAAYPIAKHTSKYGWVKFGERFRLAISGNFYVNYSNDDVRADFEALKNGEKSLEDLASHFWYGEKDMWLLGMETAYK